MAQDGQLDPVRAEGPESDQLDAVEAEVVEHVAKRVAQQETRRILTTRYRGPIPPASELKAYEDVLPGSADRIISMAEKALDASIDVDTTLAKGDVQSIRRGQWQSTVIVGTTIGGAVVSAVLKLPWEVVAAFMIPSVFEFGSSLIRTIREPSKTKDDDDSSN